ncbi:hypothetical protein BFP72_01015 [Reichenbachiella sp. 5M10]|nr:hypothetical protein BFP72_01015 [Reichenbachiella sp. 5M10]
MLHIHLGQLSKGLEKGKKERKGNSYAVVDHYGHLGYHQKYAYFRIVKNISINCLQLFRFFQCISVRYDPTPLPRPLSGLLDRSLQVDMIQVSLPLVLIHQQKQTHHEKSNLPL